MRSRQMLIKLGGMRLPPIEVGCPDISLLTPEEQDRLWELAEKVNNTLEGLEPGITIDEFREAEGLLAKVPRLGPGETFAGPKIEVPRALQGYWAWVKPAAGGSGYRFRNLGKVETLRFVELCKYYSEDESRRGMRLVDRMLPLDEWQPDDKEEMEAMLEKAARPRKSWLAEY
jgi:hypothetical protein